VARRAGVHLDQADTSDAQRRERVALVAFDGDDLGPAVRLARPGRHQVAKGGVDVIVDRALRRRDRNIDRTGGDRRRRREVHAVCVVLGERIGRLPVGEHER
jgi:hypothetical protein